jgi:hypothetical protein
MDPRVQEPPTTLDQREPLGLGSRERMHAIGPSPNGSISTAERRVAPCRKGKRPALVYRLDV